MLQDNKKETQFDMVLSNVLSQAEKKNQQKGIFCPNYSWTNVKAFAWDNILIPSNFSLD